MEVDLVTALEKHLKNMVTKVTTPFEPPRLATHITNRWVRRCFKWGLKYPITVQVIPNPDRAESGVRVASGIASVG